jgi:hypothetical protein
MRRLSAVRSAASSEVATSIFPAACQAMNTPTIIVGAAPTTSSQQARALTPPRPCMIARKRPLPLVPHGDGGPEKRWPVRRGRGTAYLRIKWRNDAQE